jgi:hypothetical protein
MLIYGDFDISDLWLDTDGARKRYIGEPLSDELLASIEAELGYQLPQSYVALMRLQNGGLLARTSFRTSGLLIDVVGIYGINRSKSASLGGIAKQRDAWTGRNPETGVAIHFPAKSYRTGSQFWIEEWGYPPIGVYFADCLSGGHDMICLDYRASGPRGEPQIVHVSQESDYDVTVIAPNFETFIRTLRRRPPNG